MATTDGLLSMAESHGAVSDPTQPSTAADGPVSFLDSVSSLGDPQTLQCLLDHQGSIRHRLQDTTRTLKVFNAFSAARFAEDAATIDEYTKLLKQTQLDLEVVFKRIRVLKNTLAQTHKDEYMQVLSEIGEAPELED